LYLYTRDYNNKESILISQEGIPIKIITLLFILALLDSQAICDHMPY
jgi:hypothetical protein